MDATKTADIPLNIKNFIPTLMWGCETGDFHTRISIFNYLSYYFPPEEANATLYIRFYDENGGDMGAHVEEIPPFSQCHFELGSVFTYFQGSIGVQLVQSSLKEPVDVPVLTNYFVIYYDNSGHFAFSHEQGPMIFDPNFAYQRFLTPIRNTPDFDSSIVVQNAYFGPTSPQVKSDWELSLLDATGHVLKSKKMSLQPRASQVIQVSEAFPQLKDHDPEELLSLSVGGRYFNRNPFTFVRHRSGDFKIHHF